MNEFKACLKKDYLDQIRNKKFLSFCLIAVGLALFVFLTFAMTSAIQTTEQMPAELKAMFNLTYSNSILYFASFMAVYFTIVVILIIKGTISKERKNKKWILPIASGIDNSKMVASKLIIYVSSILIAMIIGCLTHFIGTIIFFDKAGVGVGTLFANYGSLIMFSLFMFVVTICLDAITNKAGISALVPILFLMLSSSVLGNVTIKGVSLLNYTPWLFADANIFLKPSLFSAAEWIFGSITYVGIMFLLITLALGIGQGKKEK